MSEDSISLISKIFRSSNSRKGTAIHQGIVAGVLLVIHTINLSSGSPSENVDFIKFTNGFTYYAIISLFATAYIILSRPFITPEIKYPKCNFCGKPMRTTKLQCDSCKSRSDSGES